MELLKRAYKENDYLKIRDFLVKTHSLNKSRKNWLIDRWNFCRYVGQSLHETFDTWLPTIGIWVDSQDEIKAVVNSEGENRGEAFFQLDDINYTTELLNEFIDHAEEYFKVKQDDIYLLNLRVSPNDKLLRKILKSRGYRLHKYKELFSSMPVSHPFDYVLPENFQVDDGTNVSDYQKGFAHGRAFGYYQNETPDDDDAKRAFESMRKAPDYNSYLDISIIDKKGEVAAFANIWYDETNKIGILEPVGTIPKYQKKGLAKAAIFEAINRVLKLGATKIHVGSGDEFYRRIGFAIVYEYEIWQKKWK